MSILKLTAVTVVSTFLTGAVWAAPVSLQYNGSAAGYQTVNLDAEPGVIIGADVNGDRSVLAGGFDMKDLSGKLGASFVAWCLDLGAYLGTSGTHAYKTTDTPFSNMNGLSAGAISRVQSIFNANYTNGNVLGSSANSAGFQLALWDAVNDDDMDIMAGVFSATGGTDAINAAKAYLLAAKNYVGGDKWRLTFLESTPGQGAHRRQNLVTATPVPVPAAGLMLLSAVGGLVMTRRRRKSK